MHESPGKRILREVSMTAIDRKRAFNAPESVFRHPRLVLQSPELSDDDKVVVLRNWKQGLIQLQQASEENMDSGAGPSDVSTQLAAVSRAMNELKGH
jgi:hypothetical protein